MGEPIGRFQRRLANRLLRLSSLDVGLGAACLLIGQPFLIGLGWLALAWGGFGLIAAWIGPRTYSSLPADPVIETRQARNLAHLLWIGAGVDLIFLVAGVFLLTRLNPGQNSSYGAVWGLIVQSAIFFIFDWQHALRAPPGPALVPIDAFQTPEHQPFRLEGGRAAALLIHGFPGSPAEMRPIAALLNEQGWTVEAVLLPGLGPDIPTLGDRTADDWLTAVADALGRLRREHDPVILVGYSMGGALACLASVRADVDALVLFAPFSWQTPLWMRLLALLLWLMLPRYMQPLRRADMNDPRLRGLLQKFMPGLDLNDPTIQSTVRQLSLPISIAGEVFKVGERASAVSVRIPVPVICFQGLSDQTVRPEMTRQFVKSIPFLLDYIEIDADHESLVRSHNPDWARIQSALLNLPSRIDPFPPAHRS
jgi:carboxylesterase